MSIPARGRAHTGPKRHRSSGESRRRACSWRSTELACDELGGERVARLVPVPEARLGVGEAVQEDMLRIRHTLHLWRERDHFETALPAESRKALLRVKERVDAEALRVACAQGRIRIHRSR